jgi:ribosomal-protein-alanine N-acetyltransferase
VAKSEGEMVKAEMKDVFGDLPSLETDRLLLRRLEADDLEDVFAYASDPEVAKHTSWPAHETLQDSREFLNYVLELYKNGEVAPWGVVLEGKVVCTCGFLEWNRHSSRAEIGYALSSRYWGRGLMTEAVRGVIAFGFRTMNLNRIQGRCEIENIASVRVMEKAGMKLEGVLREHEYSEGNYLDIAIYSILRREWVE